MSRDRESETLIETTGKSTTSSFPLREPAASMATPSASAAIGSDQIQPKYGMPMNSYPGQQQPPPSLLGKPDQFALFCISVPKIWISLVKKFEYMSQNFCM